MELVEKQLSEITPYESNPRLNQDAIDAVMRSIQRFDYLVPIVVDSAGLIVTGHTRYEALKRLGKDTTQVIVADHLTEAEAKAFRLADNRTGENARWDEDLLRFEMEQLKALGFDLPETGFSLEEIDCLIDPIDADCLDDLSIDIMGKVDTVVNKDQQFALFSLGMFRFYAAIGDYNNWEKKMLLDHGDFDGVTTFIAKALGLKVSSKKQAQDEFTKSSSE